jgi:hypothetical protein
VFLNVRSSAVFSNVRPSAVFSNVRSYMVSIHSSRQP